MTENRKLIARQSLHEALVSPVRDMILDGELRPGEKVVEEALCDRFGVSRTPIREALKVLAAEGILEIIPHRGTIVAQITEAQVTELFPIMASLERLAGRLACKNASDRAIAKARAIHDRMAVEYSAGDERAYLKSNREFHECIFAISRNEALLSYYRQILVRIRSCRFIARKSPEQWRQAMEDHGAIIAALEARDVERLGNLMEAHIVGVAMDVAISIFGHSEAV
jgi:DNA-binding GntR family transcriptional regulator